MIVNKITSDKKVWLDTMLNEELRLNVDVVGSPLKSALIMFVSFLVGGMLPIIPFFFGSGYSALLMAVGISVTASFIVGAIKITNGRNWYSEGWFGNGWSWKLVLH